MLNCILRRSFTSSPHFNKGRLTLAKLKDKVTIDGSIKQLNVLFPDQFGRIHTLKVDAEYFIEENEMFTFNYNPFKYDISAKEIQNIEVPMPDSLVLKPDHETLRIAPWLKNEAYVISDIYDPSDLTTPFEIAPRSILKKCL